MGQRSASDDSQSDGKCLVSLWTCVVSNVKDATQLDAPSNLQFIQSVSHGLRSKTVQAHEENTLPEQNQMNRHSEYSIEAHHPYCKFKTTLWH